MANLNDFHGTERDVLISALVMYAENGADDAHDAGRDDVSQQFALVDMDLTMTPESIDLNRVLKRLADLTDEYCG